MKTAASFLNRITTRFYEARMRSAVVTIRKNQHLFPARA